MKIMATTTMAATTFVNEIKAQKNISAAADTSRGAKKSGGTIGVSVKVSGAMTGKGEAHFQRIAVVLVRGMVDVTKSIKDTLAMLRLTRKNMCVVVSDTPTYKGMLHKAKDYITWGQISENTFHELVAARGQEFGGPLQDRTQRYTYTSLQSNGKHYKPYFRLNPPLKGFGRKGIKVSFKAGGALGNRREKMNDLVRRML